jgi:hypothetical protein
LLNLTVILDLLGLKTKKQLSVASLEKYIVKLVLEQYFASVNVDKEFCAAKLLEFAKISKHKIVANVLN